MSHRRVYQDRCLIFLAIMNQIIATIQQRVFDYLQVRVDLILQWKGTKNTGKIQKKLSANTEFLIGPLELNSEFVTYLSTILLPFNTKGKIYYDKRIIIIPVIFLSFSQFIEYKKQVLCIRS